MTPDAAPGHAPVTPTLRIRTDWEERPRLELFVKDPRLAAVVPNGELTWEIPIGRALLWLTTLTTFVHVLYREKVLR